MRSKEVETAINNCKILIECLEKYKDTFYFTNEKAPLKASKGLDTVLDYINELEEKVNRFNDELDLDYVDNNFIPKDKIREKIKELDKEEQELQNSISEEEREEYSDANISFLLCDIETRRKVLKELLGGEE